jgi:hypothetical protein
MPAGEGAPVADSSVTAEAGSMVQISQPAAEVASAPVEGGGPDDPAIKANKDGLFKRLTTWASGTTGVSFLADQAAKFAGWPPEVLMLIIAGVFAFGLLGAYLAWRDFEQTKDLRSRPDRINVK